VRLSFRGLRLRHPSQLVAVAFAIGVAVGSVLLAGFF
jgi:uncharacterized membrane protein YciS (DUF1049 family)